MSLALFNAAATGDAVAVMMSCCASRQFAAAMAAGRPYPSFAAVEAAISAAFESLGWDDVATAELRDITVLRARKALGS